MQVSLVSTRYRVLTRRMNIYHTNRTDLSQLIIPAYSYAWLLLSSEKAREMILCRRTTTSPPRRISSRFRLFLSPFSPVCLSVDLLDRLSYRRRRLSSFSVLRGQWMPIRWCADPAGLTRPDGCSWNPETSSRSSLDSIGGYVTEKNRRLNRQARLDIPDVDDDDDGVRGSSIQMIAVLLYRRHLPT